MKVVLQTHLNHGAGFKNWTDLHFIMYPEIFIFSNKNNLFNSIEWPAESIRYSTCISRQYAIAKMVHRQITLVN